MAANPKYTPAVPDSLEKYQKHIDLVIAYAGVEALEELQALLREAPDTWAGHREQIVKAWLIKFSGVKRNGR